METFLSPIPSSAGVAAPSGMPEGASLSPDTAGDAAGMFRLLMDGCLAEYAEAGDTGRAPGTAKDDEPAGAEIDGPCGGDGLLCLEGMASAALPAAGAAVIAQTLPEEDAPAGGGAEGSTEAPAGGTAAAPCVGGPHSGKAAAQPQDSAGAFPVPEKGAEAAPAAEAAVAHASNASAVAGKDAAVGTPASQPPASPADAPPVSGESATAPAVFANEIAADAPERPDAGKKEAAGEEPSGRAVRGAGDPERPVAASGEKPSVAPGEGIPARAHEGHEPMRGGDPAATGGPADPAAPHAAASASAHNPAETPSVARPAGGGQAAPAQREFQAGEHAFVLTRRSDTSVEVTLSPPGVGRLEIEVVLDKGVVNASVTAADPAGREAIERSLPQIVQALADEGMAVGGFTVSLKQDREQEGNAVPAGRGRGSASAAADAPAGVRSAAAPSGLVDIFV